MSIERENLVEHRLVSVDALRGFTMFWIIGGANLFRILARASSHPTAKIIQQQQQLSHVNYGGFHFYDLIFPMFLFIVGVVLPFSVSRRLSKGQSHARIHLHAAKRAGLLILLRLIRDAGLLTFDLQCGAGVFWV
jgi:predicted acyltransferase